MCAIGLPVDTGTSALPSTIGPASAVVRPQKSHSTGAAPGTSSLRSSRLSLQIEIAGRNRDAAGPGTRTGTFLNHTNGRDRKRPERGETRSRTLLNDPDGRVISENALVAARPYTADPRTVTGSANSPRRSSPARGTSSDPPDKAGRSRPHRRTSGDSPDPGGPDPATVRPGPSRPTSEVVKGSIPDSRFRIPPPSLRRRMRLSASLLPSAPLRETSSRPTWRSAPASLRLCPLCDSA